MKETNKELRRKVETVLNSDATTGAIARYTGLNKSSVSRLRNGYTKIDNTTLVHAEKIATYADVLEKSKVKL